MHNTPHQTGFAQAGDLRIFYRHFASRTARTAAGIAGDPLLILHGLSYFSYDWIPVASALAEERDVVAIDLRGFGESDRSAVRDYGMRSFAADVVAVLDHLGWPRAVLAGHSMGGRIALCTAAWYPDRVSALVCLDFAPDVAAEGRRNVALRIGNQPDAFASVDHALHYHGYDPALPADAPLRQRFEAFLEPVAGEYRLKRDLHFRDTFRETLATGQPPAAGIDPWALLAELAMPLLFVRGRTSDMFAADTLPKLVAANPRVTTAEIDGSHDLPGDNPEGVVAVVRRFLAAQ
jgi:pimeloyl-ACP methyl ester carboxylesterase